MSDETLPQSIYLTPPQYNALVVRAALIEHDRVIQTRQSPRGMVVHGEIPGRPIVTLADPHKQREFDMGLYDGRTHPKALQGGRPQIHASRRQAQAAAARAYRVRQRLRIGR